MNDKEGWKPVSRPLHDSGNPKRKLTLGNKNDTPNEESYIAKASRKKKLKKPEEKENLWDIVQKYTPKEPSISKKNTKNEKKQSQAETELAKIIESESANTFDNLIYNHNIQTPIETGPRIKIINGEITIDTTSLQVDPTHATSIMNLNNMLDMKVSREDVSGELIQPYAHVYPRSKANKWTTEENETFYKAIGLCGIDMLFLSSFFPNRSQKQLRLKLISEQKKNPKKILDAMNNVNKNDLILQQAEKLQDVVNSIPNVQQRRVFQNFHENDEMNKSTHDNETGDA